MVMATPAMSYDILPAVKGTRDTARAKADEPKTRKFDS
jgi:hypothetical protein